MNFWDKVRRNHGLEHATISLLLTKHAYEKPMAGYSIPNGFLVIGSVKTEEVELAARDALARMQAGEADLAISPFCGTNIVVAAALTTIGSLAGYRFGGRGLRGFQRAFSNAALAITASRPIGRIVQRRYTTSGDVRSMSIHHISRRRVGNLMIHWVSTRFA